MACVPEPVTLLPLLPVIVTVPVPAFTFSVRLPGLVAANASTTEIPPTDVVDFGATERVAGTVITGPVGAGVGGGVGGGAGGAPTVMAIAFVCSRPAWSHTSTTMLSVPPVLPAV